MNLFERLNRLDDSLVESKRVVKKEKLTESTEKTKIEVKFEPYTRYGYEPITTARVSGKDLLDTLLKMTDSMHLYVNSDYAAEYEEDYGVKLTDEDLLKRIAERNGDGCDFIFYIKNLTTGEMLFDSGYEESEDWDDDIDEMLTESIKVEPIVDKIVDIIEHNGFTNRSVSSTDSTITMEDKDGGKTTYAVKVKMVPHFILEEELIGTQVDEIKQNIFIEEAAVKILSK